MIFEDNDVVLGRLLELLTGRAPQTARRLSVEEGLLVTVDL